MKTYITIICLFITSTSIFAKNPTVFIDNRDFLISLKDGVSNTHNEAKYITDFSGKSQEVATSLVKGDYRLTAEKSKGKLTRITEVRKFYQDDSGSFKKYRMTTSSLANGKLNSFTWCDANKSNLSFTSFLAQGCLTVTPKLCGRMSEVIGDKEEFYKSVEACDNVSKIGSKITGFFDKFLKEPSYKAQVSENTSQIEAQVKQTIRLKSLTYDVGHNIFISDEKNNTASLFNITVKKYVEICQRVGEFLPQSKISQGRKKDTSKSSRAKVK